MKEIRAARSYMQFSNTGSILIDLYNQWRFLDAKVSTSSPSITVVDPDHKDELKAWWTSISRFGAMKTKWMSRVQMSHESLVTDVSTMLLPPDGYRDVQEVGSAIFCGEFFQSDDLSEQCSGVSLAERVRAYTILRQDSAQVLSSRQTVNPLLLRKWCLIKAQEGWISGLVAGGIEQIHAEAIVKFLRFDSRALDLFDSPLVEVDNMLVGLPTILSIAEPGLILISSLARRKVGLRFKGDGFERRMRNRLKAMGMRSAIPSIPGKVVKSTSVTSLLWWEATSISLNASRIGSLTALGTIWYYSKTLQTPRFNSTG